MSSQFSSQTLQFVPYLIGTEAGFNESYTTLEDMGDVFLASATTGVKCDVYTIPKNKENCKILSQFLITLNKCLRNGISYGIYADLTKIYEHMEHLETHSALCEMYIKRD